MRFYLNDNASAYSPAVAKGAWDDITNQPNIGGLQTTQAGAAATLALPETSVTNNWDVLLATFVSDALWGNVAFKTTDTVKAILGVLESNAAANMFTHIHIWVTTGNTDVVRGTLLLDNIGSTEWPTTAAGLKTGLINLANNVNALAGDHIVVEVGYQAQNTVSTSFTGTLNFGATTPTVDLTNGDTSVVAHPSWIEFSTVFPPQVVLLGSILDTNSGTHTVTATPTGNDLIVIVTRATGNTAATTPTDNNVNGGTYVLAKDPSNNSATALKNTSADLMQVFVRTTLIQQPNSTVFTHAPGASTGGGLEVYAIRGMAKVGLAAILQVATQANQVAATAAPVLAATPQANNPILTGIFNATNPAAVTQRTSYTRDTNGGYATPTSGSNSAHLNNAEASATITWGGASATAFCSFAIEFDMSITALSNQSDVLTGGSLITSKWYDNTQAGGTTSYDGSGAHMTAPALTANGEAEIEAQQRYTAVGSQAFVQAVITQVADVNAEAGMTVYQDEQGNQLQLMVINGNLTAGYIQRGTGVTVGSPIGYNATTMKWLRIREASGTIFWDYSSDGITWTNLTSMDAPMDVSLVRTSVLAFNGASSATAEIGVFSQFNITPTVTSSNQNFTLLGVG